MSSCHKLSVLICLFSTSLFIVGGCKQELPGVDESLNEYLDSIYAANSIEAGIMIHVECPDKNISWTAARGFSDKKTRQPLMADQPVLIASNTKTYVAAAILKLIEQGSFSLEQSIDTLLSPGSALLLREDGYDLSSITVRHLLSHTSGIHDYVDDHYFDAVNESPDREWTRDEQIALAIQVGDPLGMAGEQFQYADVNYLLLTEIIEQQTDLSFFRAMRNILDYEKHGLRHTWFVNLEEAPTEAKPLAHQYWKKLNWDSYEINPSWDLYGGGGMVATTTDVARFFQLLFEGHIIQDDELLAQMHTYVLPQETSVYCLGIRHINFNGASGYYHGGFWGTDVMYLPKLNCTVAIFSLQREERELNATINKDILQIIENAEIAD